MKVGLYVRVSTDEQAKEGFSVAAQSRKLQQYAEFSDWEGTLYVDDGYSAKDLRRPQVNQLFKDIKSGKIQAIVIHKLDRLTRSVKNLHEILELFDKHKCKLVSLTESLDTSSASGRFFITMLGAMAQWERETISERTAVGLKEATKAGSVSGRVPLGYIKKDGKFLINEPNAKIVRAMFEKYNSGIGAFNIVKEFQREGIIPLDEPWDHTKVLRVIKNRVYIGEYEAVFNDGEKHINYTAYPPIIEKDLFESVQILVERNKSLKPREKMQSRLFSGIINCSLCDAPIHGSSPKGLRYKCKNKYTLQRCKCGTFTEDEFEKEFVIYMSNLLTGLNSTNHGEFKNKVNSNKLKMQKELDKIKSVKLKNHTAFENDLIPLEAYKARILELNEREKELIELLGKEQTLPRIFSLEIQDFETLWSHLERNDKRTLLLKSIKKISMYKKQITRTHGVIYIDDIEFS